MHPPGPHCPLPGQPRQRPTPPDWAALSAIPGLDRRHFVKLFFLGTAASALGSHSWTQPLLADVRPAADGEAGQFILKLSDAPALAIDGGSIRIGTSDISFNYSSGLYYPFLIQRAAGGVFHVLDSQCPHSGCVVEPFNKTSQVSACPCHGSTFRIDGRVLTGPATSPLRTLPFVNNGNGTLTITLPDVAITLNSTLQPPPRTGPRRTAIEFLAFAYIQYEVRHRASLDQPWTIVPFSTTPDGPLTQKTLTGYDDFVTLYAEATGPQGFFLVTLKTRVV